MCVCVPRPPGRSSGFRLIRKGAVGGWRECFTTERAMEIFNETAGDMLVHFGYTDPGARGWDDW